MRGGVPVGPRQAGGKRECAGVSLGAGEDLDVAAADAWERGEGGRTGLSAGSLREPPRRISCVAAAQCGSDAQNTNEALSECTVPKMRRGAGAQRPRAQPRSATPAGAPRGSRSLGEPPPAANYVPPAPRPRGGDVPWAQMGKTAKWGARLAVRVKDRMRRRAHSFAQGAGKRQDVRPR